MKTYISGLMEPLTDDIRVKFEQAEGYLKDLDHSPINPLRSLSEANSNIAPWSVRLECLSGCEAIYLLSGWLQNPESQVEKYMCEVTGKTVLFQDVIEGDHYVGEKVSAEASRIQGAIEEVLRMRFKEYENGPRDDNGFFARMIFAIQCQKAGISPQMTTKLIKRDRTTILRYLSKYNDEHRYNPVFRELAEKVNKKLYPEVSHCNSSKQLKDNG